MKVNTDNKHLDIPATTELHITKIINAPVELVWEVWTDPEHITNWWGTNRS